MAKGDDKKEPQWANEPPPGFLADGTSLIVPAAEWKPYEPKIKGPDGNLYTPEEYAAAFPLVVSSAEEDDDLSDLDELGEIANV